jgi:tetratricopeptide (TPR) repeat protein
MEFRKALASALMIIAVSSSAWAQAPTTPEEKATWLKANGAFDTGNFLLKSKKYKEAVARYKEAIELWPNDWHYHYNLALALKHSGNGAEAVTAFRKSLELNEKDWKCWKALGNTYWRMGQYTDASGAFENSLKHGAPPNEQGELRAGIAACKAKGK